MTVDTTNLRVVHFLHQSEHWSGARYMLWVQQRWREFDEQRGALVRNPRTGAAEPAHHTPDDWAAFDRWLTDTCNCQDGAT